MKNNKILLLRRFNTGYWDGHYSFIAGHVDPNETFTQCIIREAKEEAGIDVKEENLKVVHVMHRKSSEYNEERVDVFFLADDWHGEVTNMEPHKCDDLSWFDLDNLPNNTIPFIKNVIQSVENKDFYSECGWI